MSLFDQVHHWHEQFESHIEDGYRGLMLFDYPQPKSQPLPPPSVLGKYDVVITTYARLTNERKVTDKRRNFWYSIVHIYNIVLHSSLVYAAAILLVVAVWSDV